VACGADDDCSNLFKYMNISTDFDEQEQKLNKAIETMMGGEDNTNSSCKEANSNRDILNAFGINDPEIG